jgi:hypothetical protein
VRRLDAALLLSSGLFLLLYYFLAYSGATHFYHENRASERSYFEIAHAIVGQHPMLVVSAAALAIGVIKSCRQGFFSFYDGLLAAALGYSVAFIKLRLDAPYYLAPVYILIIPALFHYTISGLSALPRIRRPSTILLLVAIVVCYLKTPRGLYSEILKIRYAREHDSEFVATLLPYKTYFLVPESSPSANTFEPALDEWRRVTLESFIDFRSHGRYTGEAMLPAITRPDDADLAAARVMILTPTRNAGLLEQGAPDFRFVKSYFGLETYAFPSLVPGSDVPALSQEFFEEGWSGYERSVDARWTDKPTAQLRIFVGHLTHPMRFTLKARAFIPGKYRLVRVMVGTRQRDVWRFEEPDSFENRSVDILPEDVERGFLNIVFQLDKAVTPKSAGLSKTDDRQLGLLCRSFRLDPPVSGVGTAP